MKLYKEGAYLVRGEEVVLEGADAKEAVAAKVGREISKEDAREYRAIEDELKSFFSTKVKLKPRGKRNQGKIEIESDSDEDLERLLALLKK